MSAAKKRTVRFYTPQVKDAQGNSKNLPSDFWDKFTDHVAKLERPDREVQRNGRNLLGVGGDHRSTAMKYIYMGKMRPRGDYPDDIDADGTEPNSLAHNPTIRELAEPAYIVPTGIRNRVAVLKTAAGPSLEDIELWISTVGNFIAIDSSFTLDAVVNKNQWQLLDDAQLISKIDVRVDADPPETLATAGKVGAAAKEVMDLGGDDATLNFTLSFGHGIPDTSSGREFTQEAKEFIRSGQYGKAIASLKIPNPDGTWRTESVNFIREVVTYQARVGKTDQDPLTPDLVLPEIQGAIMDSREFLDQ